MTKILKIIFTFDKSFLFLPMSEPEVSPQSDYHKLKAKGKSLHRRVHSNTAFDMTALLDRRPDPEQYTDLAEAHNIIDSNAT